MIDPEKKLFKLRKEIDKIDRKIISALAARMSVSKKIGLIKNKNKIPVIQATRWNELIKNRLQYSKKLGLTPKVIDNIFKLVQEESIAIQKKVNKND